ncbi:putative ribonuclease H-like domain-containing protein [Tanacetum coccineum]
MGCSVPHSYDQIKAMVKKQIEEDRVRQLAMMNLAHQFNEASIAKDELRKAYEECRDIPQEQRAVIENFLKIESELDYEMNRYLLWNGAKLGKQIRDKKDHEVMQLNQVCGVLDAYAFPVLPEAPLSFQASAYRIKKVKGIMISNKARLVAQGYTQVEGTDYEFLSLVARIEAIRLFLAYALFKDFMVYQMDVKSGFLYGKIKEEVAGRKGDILLVQVYVDDIIFGSIDKKLCNAFEKLMHEKFQMSSMGELTFFLGLQVQQKKDGIFISQDKYVVEILKKFRFTEVKTASTPMETQKPLLKDEDGEEVDVHMSMIGSLMYLTSSRPDIMFVVCACARYQVNPKVSHLHAVKRIFRYLKGQPKLGLWYPKDSPFDLVAYTDSDYAGASLDRKSTTGEAEYVTASSCYGQVLWIQNQLLDYGLATERMRIESKKAPVFGHSDEHSMKFHGIKDAKTLWEAIKARFGGNKESKKMQKTILK